MKQVMIVEDQKMIRSLLESYIEKEPGYQVAVAIHRWEVLHPRQLSKMRGI